LSRIMKRRKFTLGSVLRFYMLQKQRTEFELHKAGNALRETEAEIVTLGDEITRVASLVSEPHAAGLTTTGWLACYRKAENLGKTLEAARARRQAQTEALAKIETQRRHWARAEETLLSLRRTLEEDNQTAAAKEQQVTLDESVLRLWLEREPDAAHEA